jgi:hypothetical protein
MMEPFSLALPGLFGIGLLDKVSILQPALVESAKLSAAAIEIQGR